MVSFFAEGATLATTRGLGGHLAWKRNPHKGKVRAGGKPSGMGTTVRAHLDTAMPEGLLLTFPGMERVGRHCALPLDWAASGLRALTGELRGHLCGLWADLICHDQVTVLGMCSTARSDQARRGPRSSLRPEGCAASQQLPARPADWSSISQSGAVVFGCALS